MARTPKSPKSSGRLAKLLARWNGLPPRKRKKIVGLLGALFLLSNLIGYSLGKKLSPAYDTEFAATYFIATNFKIQSENPLVLSVQAGPRLFSYPDATGKVGFKLPPPDVVAKMRLERRDMFEEHEKFMEMIGITAAPTGVVGVWSQLKKAGDALTAPERTYLYWTAGITMLTGGAIGFFIGYKDKQDWDAPNFLKGMNDERVWRNYFEITLNCINARNNELAILAAYDAPSSGFTPETRTKIEQNRTKIKRDLREGVCAKYLKWVQYP